MKELNVYLSGEIHTDWRDQIVSMTEKKGLNVQFTSPVKGWLRRGPIRVVFS